MVTDEQGKEMVALLVSTALTVHPNVLLNDEGDAVDAEALTRLLALGASIVGYLLRTKEVNEAMQELLDAQPGLREKVTELLELDMFEEVLAVELGTLAKGGDA